MGKQASHIREKSKYPTHPFHCITTQQTIPRLMKQITFNTNFIIDINTKPNTINNTRIKTNMKHIHSTIVNKYHNTQKHNKITNTIPFNNVHHIETTLHRETRRTKYPSPLCPFAKQNHAQHIY